MHIIALSSSLISTEGIPVYLLLSLKNVDFFLDQQKISAVKCKDIEGKAVDVNPAACGELDQDGIFSYFNSLIRMFRGFFGMVYPT